MEAKLLNHTVKCKNPRCIGGRIETTLEDDSGYSNWTVLESGFVEFKCHGCGKFGSTNEFKNKENNQLDNFEVKCDRCGSTEWDYVVGDVDGEEEPTHVYCKKCGVKSK